MNVAPLAPEEALSQVLARISPLAVETVAHAQALGRVLASEIKSSLDLPPFRSSAMDGYALRAEDVVTVPQTLRLLETIGAGEVATQAVGRGQCIKIMTGAPVPEGANCVVMREETRAQGEKVEFLEAARRGQHVRPRGDDVHQGEVVFDVGIRVNAAVHAMLASLGCARVEVFRRPRVALVVTGKELVDVDATLKAGQIRDSNSWALRALVAECGAGISSLHRTGDEVSQVEAVVREALRDADVLISSGGVSAGDFDPMRDVLLEHADVHFWKVNMKPGKPLMFASLDNKPVFALPGNPVSVMVAFEEFVRPALLKMAGQQNTQRIEVEATLQNELSSSPGRTEFVRARLQQNEDGLLAVVAGDQNSGRLSTMARANALLCIGPEVAFLPAGARVRAKLLGSPEIGGF